MEKIKVYWSMMIWISATQQSCYLKKQAMRSIFKTRCLK